MVYSNTYFRVDQPQDVAVSIAANGQGAVVVTWYQARLGQSFFAVSSNFGRTWSAPELVSGAADHTSAQSSVGLGPAGEFLLVYINPGGRGCGLNQRKSADGGATWSASEVILGEMTRCPVAWRFAASTNKLWMIGALPQGGVQTENVFNTSRVVANIL
ncbi:MAG: exo-alpha-sialidase, partial [Anaerolineae bacterium]|nr:exo-alpha-sialidase [Anaerolineae bacterium]